MKVKEVTNLIFDTVIIYKAITNNFGEYKNIYKGNTIDIPFDILEMEVKIIGAVRKNIIDIQVI